MSHAFDAPAVHPPHAQSLLDALEPLEQALRLEPNNPALWNNLGVALKNVGQFALAVTALQQAISLAPAWSDAYLNLGNALRELDRFDEAESAYHEALALDGPQADIYANLASTLYDAARYDESTQACQQALQLAPQHAQVHLNHALALLMAGHYEAGWEELEWRRHVEAPPWVVGHLRANAWQGEPLAGKTLLLYAEQGLGDTLQFVRYAALARQQGARVLACVQPELVSLLARCPDLEQVVCDRDALEGLAYDVHASLMSLPRLFKTDALNLPARMPYVAAEPERVAHFRERLQPGSTSPPLKVGMAWSGNVAYKNNHRRSNTLAAWAPLGEVECLRWYSLQKGPRAAELPGAPPKLKLQDLASQLETMDDTAAALEALDLLITVDTSVAHLAGALGRPTWLLLAYAPDWRWQAQGASSPWYPSMRLFRQPRPGDWATVMAEVAAALSDQVKR